MSSRHAPSNEIACIKRMLMKAASTFSCEWFADSIPGEEWRANATIDGNCYEAGDAPTELLAWRALAKKVEEGR